jgi:hypothetical protein
MITDPKQELELWDGTITSSFKVNGKDVKVVTQGDFESDAVAFTIESDLIRSGDLQVEMDFPYPPIHTTAYKYEVGIPVLDNLRLVVDALVGLCRCVRLPTKSHYHACGE